MKKLLIVMVAALWLLAPTSMYADGGKREFRGAWMQFVNGMYLGKSTAEIQQMLTHQLDELEKDGANAIIFQVRGECDALYERARLSRGAVTSPECRARHHLPTGTQWHG